jgi:tetratricopeptide (TPR) repeat protein
MLLKEQYTDKELNSLTGEAAFHLGWVLYEQARTSVGKRFDPAVDALQQAIDLDPDNTPAYYFLGEAILGMIERNIRRRAEEALHTYLARGAPLGHEDEVREKLGVRKGPVP